MRAVKSNRAQNISSDKFQQAEEQPFAKHSQSLLERYAISKSKTPYYSNETRCKTSRVISVRKKNHLHSKGFAFTSTLIQRYKEGIHLAEPHLKFVIDLLKNVI